MQESVHGWWSPWPQAPADATTRIARLVSHWGSRVEGRLWGHKLTSMHNLYAGGIVTASVPQAHVFSLRFKQGTYSSCGALDPSCCVDFDLDCAALPTRPIGSGADVPGDFAGLPLTCTSSGRRCETLFEGRASCGTSCQLRLPIISAGQSSFLRAVERAARPPG